MDPSASTPPSSRIEKSSPSVMGAARFTTKPSAPASPWMARRTTVRSKFGSPSGGDAIRYPGASDSRRGFILQVYPIGRRASSTPSFSPSESIAALESPNELDRDFNRFQDAEPHRARVGRVLEHAASFFGEPRFRHFETHFETSDSPRGHGRHDL